MESKLFSEAPNGLLRVITCGSVDDGKSTLLGRLLYDSKLLFDDQLSALEASSRKHGTTGGNLDFALLVDGLAAEVEQGITIDVAYRFFATETRKFIVADTPGHEQYTRNMVTGASMADMAVLLVDARQGVMAQTRRHAYLAYLLGVRHVVMAVNKMDLVDYNQDVFRRIRAEFASLSSYLDIDSSLSIPVSALLGDNITSPSPHMDWYTGPTLLHHLETASVSDRKAAGGHFRMPVQWVNRPNLDFRGFSGTIASGTVKAGDKVMVLPSTQTTTVKDIITYDGKWQQAQAGDAVTLTLENEIDISRSDTLCHTHDRAEVASQFAANLIWMDSTTLYPGRSYLMKIAAQTVPVTITEIKHKININTYSEEAAKELKRNEIAAVNLNLDQPIAFDSYDHVRATGGFIIIDRVTNQTVGAGMLKFALRRSQNVHLQHIDMSKNMRAGQKNQTPRVIWFTGLSGSGKSTIANQLDQALFAQGKHCYVLDGDNIRHGLNNDLGFSDVDRVENIRRITEVAKLMFDAGLIVIVAFISPFRSDRRMARQMIQDGAFIEVFVDTPMDICEKRDPKGLYSKARDGKIKNFTGIDSAYEPPQSPEVHLDGTNEDIDTLIKQILDAMQ